MADFSIKAGDTLPAFVTTLFNPDGSAVNLTGATVVLKIGSSGTHQLALTRTCQILGPTAGLVTYVWQAGDTSAIAPGLYAAEVEVTFAPGVTETFPNTGYLSLEIIPDL